MWVVASRKGVLLFFFASSLAATAHAGGWTEAHQTSDDVRITVEPDGTALVQHHLRYRVVAGRFKSFEIAGIHQSAELSPETVIVSEKATAEEIAAHVEPVTKTPGTIKIAIDEGKGLTRGGYTFDVKYKLDLVATKLLVRDGGMWKLTWTAPPAPEGHDGARVTFDLPSAPTEPRLAAGPEGSTTLATLRRALERDELELVRAHVPRGDAIAWSARVDPKAFPKVTSPELRPPPAPPAAAPSFVAAHLAHGVVALGFALVAGGLAVLLRTKRSFVKRAAKAEGARSRSLIELPWGLAPFAYGIATAAGAACLLWSNAIAGALLLVVAILLAAHRATYLPAKARGPGVWKPISDARALLPAKREPARGDVLDLSTNKGRIVLAAVALAIALTSWLLRTRVPGIVVVLPLASSVLLPIFATGMRADLPARPSDLAALLLRPARDALGRTYDLAHAQLTTIARTRADGSFDEVRLACAPADRTPGLRSIELALAPTKPGAWAALLEVLVRFEDGSEAAARMANIAKSTPVVPGRVPEEKVIRFVPDEPTPRAAASLLGRLLDDLEGRRASDRGVAVKSTWSGKERRTPRSLRAPLTACAAAAST